MDVLTGLFSGDPGDLSRISLPGLIITVVGLALYLVGPHIKPQWKLPIRFAALAVVVGGALITMKII